MKQYLAYLKYVVRHKHYVFLAACKAGIPFRGIIHDWDKFLPDEFFGYANHFYNPDGTKKGQHNAHGFHNPFKGEDEAFERAWFNHQRRNKHHFEWWTMPNKEGGIIPIKMKPIYVLEMICDGVGAGKAQGTLGLKDYYEHTKHTWFMHPESRALYEKLLDELGDKL